VTVRFSTARATTEDEWLMTQLGHERRVEVITMNFTSVFASVVGTQRVATVHKRLACYYQQYLPIRLFDIPFKVPRVVEAMQWNSHFAADPGNRWLRATLKEAAQSLSPGL
jgi:LysR family nod box-dependent transcriptional activator